MKEPKRARRTVPSALTLSALILAAGTSGAVAAAGDVHRVTAERVNLRSGPSDETTVRSTVEQGDELVELRSEDGWLGVRVMRTGEEGWIFGELVEQLSSSQLGGEGGDVANAGFERLSEGFDALVGRMSQQLGYRLIDQVEQGGDGVLRVTPSPEFLLYGGRDTHIATALAIYQMWKNHQNNQPVTVALLDDRGQDYISVADEADGPQLALQPPPAVAEAE